MNKKILFSCMLLTMCALPSLNAQTVENDTTKHTVRIGYTSTGITNLAGAIDQVTEERMNKGFVTSSIDALSGQAAGVKVMDDNQEAMVNAVRVRGPPRLPAATTRW